tara:strand:- start:208 stop:381 length:174 start_codon:yes stop_codon:yes gene_type:complete
MKLPDTGTKKRLDEGEPPSSLLYVSRRMLGWRAVGAISGKLVLLVLFVFPVPNHTAQ